MGAELVKNNIKKIYEKRKAAIYALCLYYAGLAINYFRRQQSNGAYWSNQTSQAKDLMFSDAFIEGNIIGWFMAHGVEYGPYLELANDGKNQAIKPIMQRFAGRFLKDVKELYSD